MPRGSELTDLQRGMVIGGHISGKSVRDVAALTGIPKSTVGNVVAKWKSTSSTEVASRSGRPAKITARGKRTLRRIVTGNMQATLIDVTEAFQESMGTSVSVNTVRKCIHELGYHNRADAHGTLRYSDSSGSAFFIFCSDHRPKITSKNPDLSICAVAKKLLEMWNSTSPEEKQPYKAKAAELKKKYKKDVAAYSTNEEDDVDKDEDDYVEDGDNFIMSKIKMMNKPE